MLNPARSFDKLGFVGRGDRLRFCKMERDALTPRSWPGGRGGVERPQERLHKRSSLTHGVGFESHQGRGLYKPPKKRKTFSCIGDIPLAPPTIRAWNKRRLNWIRDTSFVVSETRFKKMAAAAEHIFGLCGSDARL